MAHSLDVLGLGRRVCLLAALLLALAGCDDAEHAGQPCAAPEECYPDVDHADLSGEVQCITRVEGGYCTHICVDDGDCCAIPGECVAGYPQVCSPFESMESHRCFLSCEPEVIGDYEESAYCQAYAHPEFICRSSGGGSANRKVCVPPG